MENCKKNIENLGRDRKSWKKSKIVKTIENCEKRSKIVKKIEDGFQLRNI